MGYTYNVHVYIDTCNVPEAFDVPRFSHGIENCDSLRRKLFFAHMTLFCMCHNAQEQGREEEERERGRGGGE